MQFNDISIMQLELDKRILKIHNKTNSETMTNRFLALLVELGELANETRCFKYWSVKGPSEKSVILEEYVDGVHFIVSIGNDLGYTFDETCWNFASFEKDTTKAFLNVFAAIGNLTNDITLPTFEKLLVSYCQLAHTLGFTKEEVYSAYVKKNEVNHARQDNNY